MNICVVGLGYVGYPLFEAFSKRYKTYGVDIEEKVKEFNNCNITSDYRVIEKCDVIFICAATPVDKNNNPDIKDLLNINNNLLSYIHDEHIIVYESTLSPYDIENIVNYLHENISYKFHVVYSPERISPGETTLKDCTKLVSCPELHIRQKVCSLYESIGVKTYPCFDYKVASLSKLLENIQRDVNIALMNEYAHICEYMNVNFDDVINAASTKYNFNIYNRGLVGGHCIPVDPYYLLKDIPVYKNCIISKARDVNEYTIEYIADDIFNKFYMYKNWCVLGLTYKENVNDIRNSGSFKLYQYLIKKVSDQHIIIHDPYIKKYTYLPDNADCYILATPHNIYKKYDFLENKPLYDIKGSLYHIRRNKTNYYGYGIVNK